MQPDCSGILWTQKRGDVSRRLAPLNDTLDVRRVTEDRPKFKACFPQKCRHRLRLAVPDLQQEPRAGRGGYPFTVRSRTSEYPRRRGASRRLKAETGRSGGGAARAEGTEPVGPHALRSEPQAFRASPTRPPSSAPRQERPRRAGGAGRGGVPGCGARGNRVYVTGIPERIIPPRRQGREVGGRSPVCAIPYPAVSAQTITRNLRVFGLLIVGTFDVKSTSA